MAETNSEIFSQRLAIAVIWNICLQVCLAVILVFIMQVDFLHPVSWLTSTFQEIVGWKMVFNIMLLALVSVFQAIIYGKYHLVPPPKYFTRFSLFVNLFTVHNMVFCLLYALSGYFTMILYSSLATNNFYVLKKSCEKYDGQCLLEDSLFLQLGGMWMGLYYFITRHVFGMSILLFPHVRQDKYQQIKEEMGSIIIRGFQNAVAPVVYYCIFYLIWGSKPRGLVSDVYSLYLEDVPLDTLFSILGSKIWVSLWFYTSLFFISVYTMRSVFNIILTEPMEFPIQSEKSLTLHSAIGQKIQFNGTLAAQDLRLLAMFDAKRRLEIFSLSQPGGHLRNWNNLLQNCLIIINEFSKDLESISNGKKPESTDASPKNNNMREKMPMSLRNLAEPPVLLELKEHEQNAQITTGSILKEEFQQVLQRLSQKPGISYLFGELVDTKLKFLLMQAQPVMWTCEGLAYLASASLHEDKYGIVQNDLPVIISTLVNLKQNLDKISKTVPRKHILNDSLAIKMKTALTSSVKRSIYKVILTFSKYINDIPLHPDVQIAIQPFLLCKEA